MNTSGWRELNTYGVFANPIYVPIITINGAASVTITVGNTYTDLGATVDDGYGNADNENIVTTSTVDVDNIGAYDVTYYYINGVGESDTKTRTVTVVALDSGGTGGKTVRNIIATAIGASQITARVIGGGESPDADEYEFTFNGDGNIKTARRWNPDAVNPSFIAEFRTDTKLVSGGIILAQTTTSDFSDWELAMESTGAGALNFILGGTPKRIIEAANTGYALWRLEYDNPTSVVRVYKDDVFLYTKTAVSLGGSRSPAAQLCIMSRQNDEGFDTGLFKDFKFYVNGSTVETATLVLNMPVNDNSSTITDLAGVDDGVLTAGTGAWSLAS